MATIHVSETIACPIGTLTDMLRAEPVAWLETFVRLSCVEGERSALAAAGIPHEPMPTPSSARVIRGAAELHPDDGSVIVPVAWRVSGFRLVPPSFSGRIIMRALDERSTSVSLDGKWQIDETRRSPGLYAAAHASTTESAKRLLANLRAAVSEDSEAPA